MWLKCSACRTDLAFGKIHWVCSVSTCNRRALRLVFCSVACWDSHVAEARHREAWAVEARAPTAEQWARELADQRAEDASGPVATPAAAPARPIVSIAAPTPAPSGVAIGSAPVRRVVGDASPATAAAVEGLVLKDAEREILIVISKMKKYIKDRSGFNCSDSVGDALSEHVRALCDDAIRAAARDERKTVLDRDVARPRR